VRGLLARSWPILALSAVLLGALWLLATVTPRVDPSDDRSCLRANRGGTKALADLCRRSRPALRPLALRQPLTDLSKVGDVLLILHPRTALSATEVKAVLAWVGAGGRLVLGDSGMPDLGNPMATSGGLGGLYQKLHVQRSMGDSTPKTLAPEPSSPLARDVTAVSLSGWGRVHVLDGAKSHAVVHLRAPDGPVIMSLSHGAGEVYVIADTSFLSNGLINKADNVVLAADLLYTLSHGKVYFDEYHHGFGGPGVSTLPVEQQNGLAWAMLATVVATVLYFSGKLWRFGAPVPAFDPQRRSVLEYVTAMGDLYRRAGAHAAALQLLRRAFLQRLALAAGLSPRAGPQVIAAAVARRYGAVGEEVLALEQRSAQLLATGQVTAAELVRLTAAMAATEQRLRRGSHPSASRQR